MRKDERKRYNIYNNTNLAYKESPVVLNDNEEEKIVEFQVKFIELYDKKIMVLFMLLLCMSCFVCVQRITLKNEMYKLKNENVRLEKIINETFLRNDMKHKEILSKIDKKYIEKKAYNLGMFKAKKNQIVILK